MRFRRNSETSCSFSFLPLVGCKRGEYDPPRSVFIKHDLGFFKIWVAVSVGFLPAGNAALSGGTKRSRTTSDQELHDHRRAGAWPCEQHIP